MSKLAEAGIIWIDESEIYVADKSLYETADKFLQAVISHVKELIDNHSEDECGWFIVPDFAEYLPKVSASYMVHRVNSEWHDSPFWELVDEVGRGHREVWYIDFGDRN